MSFNVVTGACGLIGRRLVATLRGAGHWVRGVDLDLTVGGLDIDEFYKTDLRDPGACEAALELGPDDDDPQIWHLAANHGGVAYSATSPAALLADNVRIDANVSTAASRFGYQRLLYASSVAVYPSGVTGCATVEADAYPANPPSEYGWSKLIGERIVAAADGVNGLSTRIARLENCYGPGEIDPSRASVIPSLCLRAAAAAPGEPLEVWGRGEIERSFIWVDEAVEALAMVMAAGHPTPVNVSTGEYVTIQHLAGLVCQIASKGLVPQMVPGPDGAPRDRLDATVLRSLGWQPTITLREGVSHLYRWIDQMLVDEVP